MNVRFVVVASCLVVVVACFRVQRTIAPDSYSNTAAAIYVNHGPSAEIEKCNEQKTPDLKAFCELRCDAIGDPSLKGFCSYRCEDIPDPDLKAYCNVEVKHQHHYLSDADCNVIRLQSMRILCLDWLKTLSSAAASRPAEKERCIPAGKDHETRTPCCSGLHKWVGPRVICCAKGDNSCS